MSTLARRVLEGKIRMTPIDRPAPTNLKSNNRTRGLPVLVPYGILGSKPKPTPSRTLPICCTTNYPPFDVTTKTRHFSNLSCFHALPSFFARMPVMIAVNACARSVDLGLANLKRLTRVRHLNGHDCTTRRDALEHSSAPRLKLRYSMPFIYPPRA